MKRIILAMSGGVDSSVSARLLQRDGWDVTGVTFRFWVDRAGAEDPAPSPAALRAAAVCAKLRIPHHVIDCRDRFRARVVDPFCEAYVSGRTPNPCVRCNPSMKFDQLMQAADDFDADHVATGHYVNVEHGRLPDSAGGPSRYMIRRCANRPKDQSYVLFGLSQEQLARCVFPLGAWTKSDVRALASELGLESHVMHDSQEICFIPDNDYAGFVERMMSDRLRPGRVVDTSGNELGTHPGVHRFTLGQRKGLGIAIGRPRYVTRIDPESATVVVGGKDDTLATTFSVTPLNWVGLAPTGDAFRADVQIRYSHRAAPATVQPGIDGTNARVTFDTPESAITPGQAAVFYRDDAVLAGGMIDAVSMPSERSHNDAAAP